MRSLTTFTGVAALALGASLGFGASSASAQNAIIQGQGATFPQGLYNNWFAQPIRPGFTYRYNTPYSAGGETVPANTGSSAGKLAFERHLVNGGSPVPAAASPAFRENLSFAGSDAILNEGDFNEYNFGRWGDPIQLPSVGGAVAISYNPDGLTRRRVGPTGLVSVSGTQANGPIIYLSRRSYCGIFTGAIAAWNHPFITADNGGVVATAPITVVVRSDGSGTTEIFTRHLDTVCDGSAAAGGFTFPDTRPTGDTGPATGSTSSNVIRALIPAERLIAAPGNGGVSTAVAANQFAIGYNSPDFTNVVATPAAGSGVPAPSVANLQNQSDINLNRTSFAHSPSWKNTQLAQVNITPPLLTDDAITWGRKLNLIDPQSNNPTGAAAYPINGFTFLNFYTCNLGTRVTGVRAIITYLIANDTSTTGANGIAIRDGFAPLPTALKTAVRNRAFSTGAVRGLSKGPIAGYCTL